MCECVCATVTCIVHLHMKKVPVPFPAAVFAADLHLSSFIALAMFFSTASLVWHVKCIHAFMCSCRNTECKKESKWKEKNRKYGQKYVDTQTLHLSLHPSSKPWTFWKIISIINIPLHWNWGATTKTCFCLLVRLIQSTLTVSLQSRPQLVSRACQSVYSTVYRSVCFWQDPTRHSYMTPECSKIWGGESSL